MYVKKKKNLPLGTDRRFNGIYRYGIPTANEIECSRNLGGEEYRFAASLFWFRRYPLRVETTLDFYNISRLIRILDYINRCACIPFKIIALEMKYFSKKKKSYFILMFLCFLYDSKNYSINYTIIFVDRYALCNNVYEYISTLTIICFFFFIF